MRWFARRNRRPESDLDGFFRSLSAQQLGPAYGPLDRHRDFKRVFSSAEGRRVLWTILDWCGLYRPVAVKGDPHETYHRDGRRDIALRIIRAMNAEPLDRPVAAEAQQTKEKA